jgi:hypothetical protein
MPADSKTRIIAETSLTSDYKHRVIFSVGLNIALLAIVGLFVSLVEALLELIMQLAERFESHFTPYELAELRSHVGMVNIICSIFIFIAIIAIVIDAMWNIYVYWKRDSFARNILELLP